MELSRSERERILNSEVHRLTRQGYQLQHSTGTSASLVMPKPPSTFGPSCILVVITFGLWLIVEAIKIFIQPIKKEKSLYLEVLPDGTVEKTTEGFLRGTTQDTSHIPTEYDNADFVMATARGKLYLFEDRLELWKGKNFQRSLPRNEATYSEGGRWESFIIRDANDEVWLDDKAAMFKKERAKVREHLS